MNITSKVIRILITSDFIIVSAFGLFGPIFAIFVTHQIHGGSATIVGIAAAVYWIVRNSVQLPIARYLDRTPGERDDFLALLIGSFLFSIVPFLYLMASEAWHIYLLQAIYGVGDALAVPTYLVMYSRHIDKENQSSQWGIRSVAVGSGAAIAGALGGIVADKFGFDVVFFITGTLAVIGSSLLIGIYKYVTPRPAGGTHMRVVPPTKEHGLG